MKIRLLVEWNDRIAFFFLFFSSSFRLDATLRILCEKPRLPLTMYLRLHVYKRDRERERERGTESSRERSFLLFSFFLLFLFFRNGQLYIADQILCIYNIYLNSYDSTHLLIILINYLLIQEDYQLNLLLYEQLVLLIILMRPCHRYVIMDTAVFQSCRRPLTSTWW